MLLKKKKKKRNRLKFNPGLALTSLSATVACVAGVRKGRGRELERETTRAPRVSLARKNPFPKAPFPFPFKRLPRRLSN